MKKKFHSLAICIVLCMMLNMLFNSRIVFASQEDEMRTKISNDSPLLIEPVYGDTENSLWWGNTLKGAWDAIPDDVKPYAAIELHPAKVCKPTSCIPKDTPELRRWYINMLDEAQANNIPVFLVIMSAGERDTVPPEWLEEQFKKYSVLKGVMNIENYWIYNDQIATNSAKYLEVCAKYGAHFIWHDHEDWFWQNVMRNENFYNAAKKYKKNLVLATKNTPIRDDASTDSIVNGMWLSGFCDNWGASSDSWKWWEKGYTNTFEPAGSRSRDMRSYASEPESMLAMEMMNVYTNGGTVYNFECAAYTFMDNDVPTPAFLNGIIPFFRHAIKNPAPSKEEVINRSKVVFWEGDGEINSIPNFYKDLYSDDETMPLYDTGRYNILPVISSRLTLDEVKEIFPNADILTKNSPELSSKVKYLNSKYPSLYTGNGYAQRVGDSWYTYNSNVNIDENQKVSLPMYVNSTKSLDIDMTAHTYGIVKEKKDSLDITLNNYRTDKSKMWSVSGNFDASQSWKQGELDLSNWLSENYCKNPDDNTLRKTVLTINGATNTEKPKINITGDKDHYNYTEEWDQDTGKYTLTINHNGYVNVSLEVTGDGPNKLPEPDEFNPEDLNLAYGKSTSQSSEAYGASSNRAVDGITDGDYGKGSVTHTNGDSPSWWKVDLGETKNIDRICIFNRTDSNMDRLSNYDVIVLDENNNEVWREHQDSYPSPMREYNLKNIKGRYVKVELKNNGVPLSLAEVEVYGKQESL
ncbi:MULTISPECIES: glycoside hydrolase family 98 domain-containing protein [Clostridium]|uniref:glycoside hydrolase family 98 domain-containing protein n=1 Tax=Clostridium TaxID=1485 RepID=UPI00189DE1D2|nr:MULTISPECIES: glycosyl hydrolase family 98 C-terminal domain-containing protein [Clostridium]MDB2091866.1 discoidin domain-containing protein [Clostridium paraputrificum]MDU1032727.1 glycosyl hydrolase family 98 C-terminal domain-containing protein [Clostridium sp.]